MMQGQLCIPLNKFIVSPNAQTVAGIGLQPFQSIDMHNQNDIISQFYKAFQHLDAIAMNNCYSKDVVFFDPMFGLLQSEEARAMWQMLCNNAQNFSLSFGAITALDDEYYICDVVVSYTFTGTGRFVENKFRANMRLVNGKIAEHSDAYSLHQWSKQAYGILGNLLGWNSFFQNKIKAKAKRTLLHNMQNH